MVHAIGTQLRDLNLGTYPMSDDDAFVHVVDASGGVGCRFCSSHVLPKSHDVFSN